jgi:ribonuclease BN (tRNA processing enzyme)
MKITFLGVSSALSDGFNSNMLLDFPNGETLLFDCGIDIKHSLKAANRKVEEIDAVYVSHLHSDHSGGLEWIGYYSYFISKKKIKLYIHESLVSELWSMLRPGMESVNNKQVGLNEYFDIIIIPQGYSGFELLEYSFNLIKNPHVVNPVKTMYSFGLVIGEATSFGSGRDRIVAYISSDTNSCLEGGEWGDIIIFHDCDFMNLGGVHINYEELKKIPDKIKSNMWLYHYHDLGDKMPDVIADGFAGIVKQGQIFEI